jgi:hypothetical protein
VPVAPSTRQPDHNYIDFGHLQHGFFDHAYYAHMLGYLDISTKGYRLARGLIGFFFSHSICGASTVTTAGGC